MQYKDLSQFTKTFVLQRTEGFGIMESPINEKEYIQDFDTEEELREFGNKVYPRDKSGWTFIGYEVIINTSTDRGKELCKDFEVRFEAMQQKIKDNPDRYRHYNINGNSISIEYNEAFDGKIEK